MKIRAKLQVGTLIAVIASLVVLALLLWSLSRVRLQQDDISLYHQLVTDAFALNVLTDTYHDDPSPTTFSQWQSVYGSLTSRLGRVQIRGPLEKSYLAVFRRSHAQVKVLFSELASGLDPDGYQIAGDAREALRTQLAVQLRRMVTGATRLEEASQARIETSQWNTGLLVILSLVIMALAVGTTSYIVSRSVGKAIVSLSEGTRVIAAGELEHRVPVVGRDEIGQLSRSFNEMTERLKATHASLAGEIAERARMEENLRLAGAYNRSLIEASLDPLVTIDVRGKITDVNAATERATGFPRGELIGTDFSDYFTEPAKAREAYQLAFRECSVQDYPLDIRRRDGQVTPVLYNASVYRDEQGKVIGVFAAARDVTQLKRAEEELKVYTTKLEWSNRELQDFAFVASHDLQEPLRKIQAFSDRLRVKFGERLDEKGKDYLERMHSAAWRMQDLIQALLNLSRVTTKAEPFSLVDLNRLIGTVMNDLEARIEQTGALVEVADLPSLEADPNQMRQLFQNLIGNALKFHGKKKPHIRISADHPDSPAGMPPEGTPWHRILVEDNGIGFDEKYLDRLFTPFQRLHDRQAYEGTGMGLAICRKIMERHGGTITARSTPGKGTTFIVTLPSGQSKGGKA